MFELILACALKKVIMGKKVHNLYLRSKGQGHSVLYPGSTDPVLPLVAFVTAYHQDLLKNFNIILKNYFNKTFRCMFFTLVVLTKKTAHYI